MNENKRSIANMSENKMVSCAMKKNNIYSLGLQFVEIINRNM